MEIERIDSYADARFDSEVLRQHGAFLMDGQYPCAFRIVDERTAVVRLPACAQTGASREAVLEEFRFYAEHITRFFDEKGTLLKEYPPVETFDLAIDAIQPSQFYVDREKLEAVSSFVKRPEDVVIPVMRCEPAAPAETGPENVCRYISLDGHTRLYCAWQSGMKQVRAFPAEENDYIYDFVKEAQDRGVYKVGGMTVLSHEEYAEKWHRFCEAYFAER